VAGLMIAIIVVRVHELVPAIAALRPALLGGVGGTLLVWKHTSRRARRGALQDPSLKLVMGYFIWALLCSFGALWLALFTLGTLHVLNPDDFILRTNMRLMQEGREFDAYYNSRLSDDAIPSLVEGLPLMNPEDQCVVKNKLYYQEFKSEKNEDFRSFNFSRSIAANSVRDALSNFNVSECPAYSESFHDHHGAH
jgi:hypothetical protein